MKRLGDSAIHDYGFQFYLTLNIKFFVEKLIKEIEILESCIATHNEWKTNDWYTTSTKVSIDNSIEGYPIFTEFTLSECKWILSQRLLIYKTLIEISEESLADAIKKSKENQYENYKPYYKDLERLNVIVDFTGEER